MNLNFVPENASSKIWPHDGEAEKKKTFIVKIPAKSEVTSSVFDSEPSLVMSEERGADTDYTQTIILQAQQEETNSAEDQNFSRGTLTRICTGESPCQTSSV